jgi:hypothetical protein
MSTDHEVESAKPPNPHPMNLQNCTIAVIGLGDVGLPLGAGEGGETDRQQAASVHMNHCSAGLRSGVWTATAALRPRGDGIKYAAPRNDGIKCAALAVTDSAGGHNL